MPSPLQQTTALCPLSGLQVCLSGGWSQGRNLPVQAVEGAWLYLDQGVLCLWYGEYGPEGEMCEPGGHILMTLWTVAPQKGAQLKESLRRTCLCMDLRAEAQRPGYYQHCLSLSSFISITSLLIPCKTKMK